MVATHNADVVRHASVHKLLKVVDHVLARLGATCSNDTIVAIPAPPSIVHKLQVSTSKRVCNTHCSYRARLGGTVLPSMAIKWYLKQHTRSHQV